MVASYLSTTCKTVTEFGHFGSTVSSEQTLAHLSTLPLCFEHLDSSLFVVSFFQLSFSDLLKKYV